MLVIVSGACAAASRIIPAVVFEKDGIPCFTVSDEFRHSDPLRLYSLQVSEDVSPNWLVLPRIMWSFSAVPTGDAIEWDPRRCIGYGESLSGTLVDHRSIPLELYSIYHLSLTARRLNEDNDVLAHTARFCMTRNSQGAIVVTPIKWSEQDKRWMMESCRAPQ